MKSFLADLPILTADVLRSITHAVTLVAVGAMLAAAAGMVLAVDPATALAEFYTRTLPGATFREAHAATGMAAIISATIALSIIQAVAQAVQAAPISEQIEAMREAEEVRLRQLDTIFDEILELRAQLARMTGEDGPPAPPRNGHSPTASAPAPARQTAPGL